MALVLDTTVLVDLGRGFRPTKTWLADQAMSELYLTTITVGELVRGAWRRNADRPDLLARELELVEGEIASRFEGRVLAFDREAASLWGRLMGEGEARGRRPSPDDAKIAAIALRHGMSVATSNVAQFAHLVATIDPRTA